MNYVLESQVGKSSHHGGRRHLRHFKTQNYEIIGEEFTSNDYSCSAETG
jgi:hypothetical protein